MSILLIVVGLLCLLIGATFTAVAFAQYEYKQGKFFTLAAYFAAFGAVTLLIRYLFIILPAKLKERKSDVANRRKDLTKLYKHSKVAPSVDKRREGGILILVLILLGVISSAALYAVVSARSSEAEANTELKAELLRLAAIDSARVAMQRLADDPDMTVDYPGEAWAETTEVTDAAGITRMIHIYDLHRAFDLNNLSVTRHRGDVTPPIETAANILIQCGEFRPGQKVEALRDWMDDDSKGLYEASFYAAKKPPSSVPNHLVQGWEELMRVEGWSPDVFNRKLQNSQKSMFESDVLDCFTIIPVPRTDLIPLNINSVDPGVLQSLLGFASDGLVARILKHRKERPYRELLSLHQLIGNDAFQRIKPYLDVKSRYFRIEVRTVADDGKVSRLSLLASRDDDGHVKAVEAFF